MKRKDLPMKQIFWIVPFFPQKISNIPETNPEGPKLEGLDFTIKSNLSEGPNKEKSKKLVKAFRSLPDGTIKFLTDRNPDFSKTIRRAMRDSAESEEEASCSSDSDGSIRIETKKKRKPSRPPEN